MGARLSPFGLLIRVALLVCAAVLPIKNVQGEERTVDELLGLDLEELMGLQVTTATKTPCKLSLAPATIRVITAQQIKTRGYFTLDEALADLPGFQFRNILGFNSYVFMRAVPSQNNLIIVMVDGIQINELNSGGFYGGGQYNLSNVERIEVVYGPASALYGTHAISGIINIITRDPKDIQGGHVSLLGGSFDTYNYDFSYGRYNESKRLGFSISGMFKQSGKADLERRSGDNNWSESMENFEDDLALDGKFQYKDFTFGFVVQDKRASRATNDKRVGTLFRDHDINWHIRFFNTYVKYNYAEPDRWSLNSTAYYRNATVLDDTLPNIKEASGGDPGYQERYYRPNDLFGLENQLNYSVSEAFDLTAGVVYEHESLAKGFSKSRSGSADEHAGKPATPDMTRDELVSVYAQGRYRLLDNVEMTLGIRRDDSDVYGIVNTPRAALVWGRGKATAKMLYAEAFRAPKTWDYTDGLGNPGLEPELMRSMELVLGYAFTDHLRIDTSIYRNILDELLVKEFQGANWRWTNSGGMETDGIELVLEYRKGKTKSYLNYTVNESTYDDGEEVPEIAEHTANVGWKYAFNRNTVLDVRGQYLGERKNPKIVAATGSDTIDDAFVVHSTLSFVNIKGFHLQIAVKNLFNTEYYHTSNRSVDRYRQPQRTVLVKAVYEF